jgi:hypothetical protein
MSLIITSSSQQEYKKKGKVNGITNPSSFSNFFSSPLKVEKDSEVALVSLKCNRDNDTITIEDDDGIFVYWGEEEPDNIDEATGGWQRPTAVDDVSSPIRILLEKGDYYPATFVAHLKDRLEKILLPTFRELASINVTQKLDDNNELEGFNIQFIQVGNGSGLTNKPTSTEFGAFIDATTETNLYNIETFGTTYHTDVFTASASGSSVKIEKIDPGGATGQYCDVIGRSHPLSQVNGKCEFSFNASTGQGYTIGLIRSQGASVGVEDENKNFACIGGMSDILNPVYGDDVKVPIGYGDDDGPPLLWDVAFNWVSGEDGQVIHLVTEDTATIDDIRYKIDTVTTAFTPTNASLEAGYWEGVLFEVSGETVKISLKQTGKATYDVLVTGLSTAYGTRVKPLGLTCNQLYPKIYIDRFTTGWVTLDKWTGHSAEAYYDRSYYGYQSLLEELQNLPESGGIGKLGGLYGMIYNAIDKSIIYADGNDSQDSLYTYKGLLTSSAGIANKWSLLTGNFEDIASPVDEVQGGLYFNRYEQALSLNNTDKIQELLGMPELMDQTTYGVSASGSHDSDITFTSTKLSDNYVKSSMFVRLKNQALNSYNANMRSISNIIYSAPRFDAQGNTKGLLFFEPHERVYVKMNNPTELILNSLDLDLVDVNERVLTDLTGNTLIVLHIRKSE